MTPDEILKTLREAFYNLNRAAQQPYQRERDMMARDFIKGLAKIGITPVEVYECINYAVLLQKASPPPPVVPRTKPQENPQDVVITVVEEKPKKKSPTRPGTDGYIDLFSGLNDPTFDEPEKKSWSANEIDNLIVEVMNNSPVLNMLANVIKLSGWDGKHDKIKIKTPSQVRDLIGQLADDKMKNERIKDLRETSTRAGIGGSTQGLTRLIIRSWHDWYVSQGKPVIWTTTSSPSPSSTSETGSISSASH